MSMARMGLAFVFAVNIVVIVLSPWLLPEVVAMHFGAGGYADDWSSRGAYMAAMLGFHFLFMLLFFWPTSRVFDLPERYLSLPNKTYWLANDERKRQAAALFGRRWLEMGIATFLLLLVVLLLTVDANHRTPVRLREMWVFLSFGVFVVYTVVWVVVFMRGFAKPE